MFFGPSRRNQRQTFFTLSHFQSCANFVAAGLGGMIILDLQRDSRSLEKEEQERGKGREDCLFLEIKKMEVGNLPRRSLSAVLCWIFSLKCA